MLKLIATPPKGGGALGARNSICSCYLPLTAVDSPLAELNSEAQEVKIPFIFPIRILDTIHNAVTIRRRLNDERMWENICMAFIFIQAFLLR